MRADSNSIHYHSVRRATEKCIECTNIFRIKSLGVRGAHAEACSHVNMKSLTRMSRITANKTPREYPNCPTSYILILNTIVFNQKHSDSNHSIRICQSRQS